MSANDPNENAAVPTEVQAIPFGEALRFWLKLGFISFGGPAGQIALMHHELVDKRRWISERRFLHALNYCMLLPGPEAQQLATYLGWLMHRSWGGILAGALFVLPSLFILIGLSWGYVAYGHLPAVGAIFAGIKPAVAAIVCLAAWRLGGRVLRHPVLWGIALAAFVGIALLACPFPLVIGLAALLGIVVGRWRPVIFQGNAHAPAERHDADGPRAIIGDDTPRMAHTFFSWQRLMRIAVMGIGLWLLTMGVLVATFGWEHTLTQMGWFFTKAALLTFGGAYAVLPYVYQAAVEHFGWLTAGQMIDGLALGETTPGPLIMVVAFVAYVGGHAKAVLGPEMLVAGGVLAAALVTWLTFLPSFVFILAGGPLVESTHGEPAVQAPLTAVSAGVVGVIASLGLFFVEHVLWPTGWQLVPDLRASAFFLFSLIALGRFKMGVPGLLAATALASLALSAWLN